MQSGYLAYFKRSWIKKRDGRYLGPPKRLPRAYFPMVYAASDAYHKGVMEALPARNRPVVCSLRCSDRQPIRCRILEWLRRAAAELKLPVAERQNNGRLGPGSQIGEVFLFLAFLL